LGGLQQLLMASVFLSLDVLSQLKETLSSAQSSLAVLSGFLGVHGTDDHDKQCNAAVGGLLGGYVGDLAAKRHPHHGRIFACQFSVAVGIPFSLLILKVSDHAALFSR